LCRSNPHYQFSELAREEPVTFEKLFQHAQKGDQVAIEIRERCLQVWGAATVALIHAYDPEVVVVGGGVMKSASVILPYLQSYIHHHAWTPWGKVKVCAAELGNDAALLGAIPLLRGLTDR
jgi:glucokinase